MDHVFVLVTRNVQQEVGFRYLIQEHVVVHISNVKMDHTLTTMPTVNAPVLLSVTMDLHLQITAVVT